MNATLLEAVRSLAKTALAKGDAASLGPLVPNGEPGLIGFPVISDLKRRFPMPPDWEKRNRRMAERLDPRSVVLHPPIEPNRVEHPFVASCEIQGIPIDIEQRKGDVREGVDRDGTPWRVTMCAHYGEVRSHARGAIGTAGARGMDSERLDVYVGDDPFSTLVVVIDQRIPETNEHDEQKVMLGFSTVDDALQCYHKQYTKAGFYGGHHELDIGEFKARIANAKGAGEALREPLFKALARLAKAKKAMPGEAHAWKDGKLHRKVGDKWVEVSAGSKVAPPPTGHELVKLLKQHDPSSTMDRAHWIIAAGHDRDLWNHAAHDPDGRTDSYGKPELAKNPHEHAIFAGGWTEKAKRAGVKGPWAVPRHRIAIGEEGATSYVNDLYHGMRKRLASHDPDAARKVREEKESAAASEAAYEAQGIDAEGDGKLAKLRGKKVWLYHGTTSARLPDILDRGLQARSSHGQKSLNVGASAHAKPSPNHVFLANSAAGAEAYARRAAYATGGEPVVLRVLVSGDDIKHDPDDSDLSVRHSQFVVSRVDANQIMEVDGKKTEHALTKATMADNAIPLFKALGMLVARDRYIAYVRSMPAGSALAFEALSPELRKAWLDADEPAELDADGNEWRALPALEGDRLWDELLEKGAGHRYLARYPTGNPKRPWKYVYKYTAKSAKSSPYGTKRGNQIQTDVNSPIYDRRYKMDVGAAFADGKIGEHTGHWVVTHKAEDGTLTFKHDVTGETMTSRDGRYDHENVSKFRALERVHGEAAEAEKKRREGSIGKEQDEASGVLEESIAAFKKAPTTKGLEAIVAQSMLVARMRGFYAEAVGRRLGVSTAVKADTPKERAKLQAEIEALHATLAKYGGARRAEYNESIHVSLAFDRVAQAALARIKAIDDGLGAKTWGDLAHGEGYDFANRLPAESMVGKPDMVGNKVEKFVDAALTGLGKDAKQRVTNTKRISGLASPMENRWSKLNMSDAEQIAEWDLVRKALEKRGVVFVGPDPQATVAARKNNRQLPPLVGRPEGLSDNVPTAVSDDLIEMRVQVGKEVRYVGIPADLALRAQRQDPAIAKFRVDHARKLAAVKTTLAETQAHLAPVVSEIQKLHVAYKASHTAREKSPADAKARTELFRATNDAEGYWRTLMERGEESHLIAEAKAKHVAAEAAYDGYFKKQDADRRAAHGEFVRKSHVMLQKALAIPGDAATHNTALAREASSVEDALKHERYDLDRDELNMHTLFANVHPDVMPRVRIMVGKAGDAQVIGAIKGRAHCGADNRVQLYRDRDNFAPWVAWHETGHAIEHDSPAIAHAVRTYLLERSKSDVIEKLSDVSGNVAYAESEQTYKDKWWSPYCGKWYDHGTEHAAQPESGAAAAAATTNLKSTYNTAKTNVAPSSEVVAMGIQEYMNDPVAFHESDPEHFHLIAAIISGRFGKRGEEAKL